MDNIISPPAMSTRAMHAQARADAHSRDKNPTKPQSSLLDRVLAAWIAPYQGMGGSFPRF